MEYEGKGKRNDFSEVFVSKKITNKTFYLVCNSCNYRGNKNELVCPDCKTIMRGKTQALRINKNGVIKF